MYELGNRLWLAIANDRESCRFSGVNSRTTASTELKLGLPALAGAGRSPCATAFISSRNERKTLNLVPGHFDLRVSSAATTVVPIPRSPSTRSTSSKKSSINVSASLNW